MNERITAAEMHSRFAGEWLLVEEPSTDADLRLQSGVVRCHSKSRDEVYRKAAELKPRRFAVLYTGEIGRDAAVIL